MKLLTVFIFPTVLILSSSVQGAESEPDLVMARELFAQKMHLKAVKIVAPCLKAKTHNHFSSLEDCLFLGEKITVVAIKPFGEQYEKETNFGRSGLKFTEWSGAAPYIKMGLNIKLGHYGGVIYDHEFLHKLKILFPISKYRQDYEYQLITRGANSIKSVKQWISELEKYSQEFPEGRYFLHATADLAHIYDNLWDILKPGSKVGYYKLFSSGNRTTDTKLSEDYRKKALSLYEEILKLGARNNPEEKKIIGKIKERYPDLIDRKKWYIFYILND